MKSSLGERTSQTYTLHNYLLPVEPTTMGVHGFKHSCSNSECIFIIPHQHQHHIWYVQ